MAQSRPVQNCFWAEAGLHRLFCVRADVSGHRFCSSSRTVYVRSKEKFMQIANMKAGSATAQGSRRGAWPRLSRGLAVLGLALPLAAWAQVPVCDGRLFLSQDSPTNLNLINTSTSPLTFTQQGPNAALTYNALAYSPSNGVLYAMQVSGATTNHLLQIGQTTGTVTDLGAVASLPTSPTYNTGTFSSTGVYYVKPFGATNVLYAINVSTLTSSTINLSQSFTTSDMAWVGGPSGTLYSVDDSGQLFSINVGTGAVAAIGSPDTTGGVLGAQFGGTNGLFGSANNGSGFYKINLTTGAKTLISGTLASGNNDGANCPNAAIQFPADLSITKTDGSPVYIPGSPITYTIVVSNAGPFGATNVTVGDSLPVGISSATWTCTGAGGGTCTASGTGGIADGSVNLPVGASVTYSLTMQVPANFTGTLANTATVTPGPDNTDPNPANNSATDSNSPAVVVIPMPTPLMPVPVNSPWALLMAALLSALVAGAAMRRGKR